jgi:putative flippase GtrA
MQKKTLIQAAKYGIVGVSNTLLTYITYWVMMHIVFGLGDEKPSVFALSVSNTVGYIIGLINSFILNRKWTFKSEENWKVEFLRFSIAFGVCFGAQLLLVLCLSTYIKINTVQLNVLNQDYIIHVVDIFQLIGMVFYTILNFMFNKYYTFRK